MAIIRSMGVGSAKKSMGNVTYRTVRGRTLGSQKVAPRPLTRATDVSLQQFIFGLITRFMAIHAADIMVSFNQTMYGSERNYFAKVNFAALRMALRPLYNAGVSSVDDISDAQIGAAIAAYATENPQSIYRVKRSGYEVVYLTGEWSSDQNPEEVNPALRVEFYALQKQDGSAYAGSESEMYIQGANLDRVTSLSIEFTEEGQGATNPSDISWSLQADGRLKVTYSWSRLDPLGGGIVVAVVRGTPSGSITWNA